MGRLKGTIITKETIAKIQKSRSGYKHSQETKDKIGKSNSGKKASLESRKKLSDSHMGHIRSEESKKKQGNTLKGKIPKNIETLHAYFRGKKRPEISGEKCHLWKGGITPENQKIRHSIEIKSWRKACMERDNFTCQKTGIRGGKLVVHHINNFADFPELRTSIENGITLSVESHVEFHKIYGKKNNTREQLYDFLGIKI